MSVVAGTLEIQMLAALSRLSTDMQGAVKIVGKNVGDIERYAGKASTALQAIGVGLTAGAFVAWAKSVNDSLASMKDFAQEAGVSVEAISKFEAPARLAGSSLDSVAGAMFKMSKAAMEAKDPMSNAGQALHAIGISTAQLKGMSPDQLFETIARSLNKFSDGAEKNAVMQELMGKSGREMSRVMKEVAESSKLTATATFEQAEEADKLQDQMVVLQMNSEKLWRSMAGMGLPVMNDIMKAFIEGKQEAGLYEGIIRALTEAFDRIKGTGPAAELAKITSALEMAERTADRLKDKPWWATFAGESMEAQASQVTALRAEKSRLEKEIHDAELREQDARALAGMKRKPPIAFDPEAMKKAAAEADRLRKLDIKGWVDYIDALEKQWEEEGKANGKRVDEARKASDSAIDSLKDYVEQLEFENAAIGMTNTAREVSIRLRMLEKAGVDMGSEAVAEYTKRLRDALMKQEEIAKQQEALRSQVSVWSDLSRVAGDFFADLVMNGKSAFDSLREWLKRFLAELLSVFAQRWILQLGASLVGGGGGSALSSAAGQVGQGTLTGAASSYVGNLLTGTGTVGTYLGQTSIMQFYGGATGAIQGPGLTGAAGAGQQTAGMVSQYSGVLGIIGAIIAVGLWAMDLYKSGWRNTGNNGTNFAATGGFSGIQQVDNRLLKWLGFSDRDAFTMSGGPIISRLFGWKARQNDAYGIRGTYSGSGITGQNWQDWSQQGGLFRSDRRGTDLSPFTTDQQNFLNQAYTGISGTVAEFGALTGVDTKALFANYSKPFDFQMNENGDPLSDEAIAKLFGDYFGSVLQEQVAMTFDAAGNSALATYVKELKGSGEEVTGFILELLGVMKALDTVDILGMKAEDLMKFQRDGETLTQTFQRVAGQWAQFQDLFYTDAEKVAMVQGQVNDVFADLGIAVPQSNEEFRALVESLDLSTESGRAMFTALMGIAPAFHSVTNAAAAAVARFNSLASTLSPTFGAANARSVLESRVRTWMGLTPGNGAAGGWTVDSTIANIGTLVREGRIGEALTYAQSLGGSAVSVLNDMLEAYIAWTQATSSGSNPLDTVTRGLGDLGNAAARAAEQMQAAKDNLWTYLQSLFANPTLSPLDPMQQLGVARGQFFDQLALAQGGDIGAASGLQAYIDRVLNLGRTAFGSAPGYANLFDEITRAAAEFARPGGAQDLQAGIYAEARTGNELLRDVKALLLDIRDKGTADGEIVSNSVQNAALATERR